MLHDYPLQNKVHLKHERPYLGIPSYIKDNEYATSANVNFLLRFAFDSLQVENNSVVISPNFFIRLLQQLF